MHTRYLATLAITASILGCGTATALFAQSPSNSGKPQTECAYCHQANAKKDDVWTQFYPLLDK